MWAQFDGEHVAGALSEYKHHTSRGQNMDRAGGGVRDAVHGQVPEALLPQEPGTQHFTLDDDDSVPELGGSRPDRIATLSSPQARDLRRTVEQIVDAVPLVPLLDDLVPQTVEQLQDVLQFFDRLSGRSRAGYRSAQDLHRGRPYARGFACYAAGRTAGWKCRRSSPFPMLVLFHAIMAQRTERNEKK